jgi:hypothetical protein
MSFVLPVDGAWCLFSPELAARADLPRWRQQAATFFDADLAAVQTLSDPVLPSAAALELDVTSLRGGGPTRVRVVTVALDEAPALLAHAELAVAAIGGAGFDALLRRARRLWQVQARPVGGGDPRAPLVVTAVLASVLLAPVVPPGERTAFGVRGARVRLMDAGWPDVRRD